MYAPYNITRPIDICIIFLKVMAFVLFSVLSNGTVIKNKLIINNKDAVIKCTVDIYNL